MVFVFLVVFPLSASLGERTNSSIQPEQLTRGIPARAAQNLTGSQFAQHVANMNSQEREEAILEENSKGNFPAFLGKLVPVQLQCELANGQTLTATIFVTPDHLAIGSDSDFLRIPMSLHTAVTIAERFGFVLPTRKFVLPTRKMVDAIYLQSRYHLTPQPLPAGPQMRSTEYYSTHNHMIEDEVHAVGAPFRCTRLGRQKRCRNEQSVGDQPRTHRHLRLASRAGPAHSTFEAPSTVLTMPITVMASA